MHACMNGCSCTPGIRYDDGGGRHETVWPGVLSDRQKREPERSETAIFSSVHPGSVFSQSETSAPSTKTS